MFQTELIMFLQSFESDFLTSFFKFFTEIGSSYFTIPLLIVIMFGVNFRKGFILSQTVIWTGIFTVFLKNIFALPRPANVDSNVRLLGTDYPNPTSLKSMGAKNFFGKLPPQIIDYLRIHRIDSWGFPSGHTSNAVTLWSSIFLLFKKTWVKIITIIFILFIPLSRMYLGRHFLADILGGFALGFIITIVFFRLVYNNEKLLFFLFEKKEKIRFDFKSIFFITYILVIPFLFFLIPGNDSELTANLLGLNSAFFLIRLRGFPEESGTLLIRILRVIITGIVFFIIFFLLKKITTILSLSRILVVEFMIKTISVSFSIWLSMEINIKLGFFKK